MHGGTGLSQHLQNVQMKTVLMEVGWSEDEGGSTWRSQKGQGRAPSTARRPRAEASMAGPLGRIGP